MTYQDKFKYSLCKMCVFGVPNFCKYFYCQNCPNTHDIMHYCKCSENFPQDATTCPNFRYLGLKREE